MQATRAAVVGVAAAFVVSASAALAKPPAQPAAAGPKDKAALRLSGDALATDYLETNFIKAERKIQQAIRLCGKGGCSASALARLHRDLAVVYLAGLKRVDAGKAELKLAFEGDPRIELDRDYVTPDLQKAWDEIKGNKAKTEEDGARSSSTKSGHGVVHVPVTEQVVATPVPIFARSEGSTRLRLWYRRASNKRWQSALMEAQGSGLAGEIPCNVTATTGEVQYFIEVLGEDDATIDRDGSRTAPHSITIAKEIAGDAPHLPDASPPAVCTDVCRGDECDGGEPATKRARKNWIRISVQQDFAIVGATVGACTPEVQVYGSYSCFRATGSQYLGSPVDAAGDNVNGGFAIGTTRLLVGYDRVLVGGLTLGAHLGYTLRGLGPRADGASSNAPMAFYAEGRLAYVFATDFTTGGFRPSIFVDGGVAQVDSHFNVIVHEDATVRPPPTQTNNPPAQQLDAYRRMGQAFIGGGAGAAYAFTPAVELFLNAKYMHLLPSSGNTLSPELGLAFGF